MSTEIFYPLDCPAFPSLTANYSCILSAEEGQPANSEGDIVDLFGGSSPPTSDILDNNSEQTGDLQVNLSQPYEPATKTLPKMIASLHKQIINPSENSAICICSVCKQIFNSHTELRNHCREHKPALSCAVCQKVFAKPSHLQRHAATHLTEHDPARRPYACGFCPRRFTGSSHLSRHLLTHLPATDPARRPCACLQCPKRFTRPPQLHLHIARYHTAPQPQAQAQGDPAMLDALPNPSTAQSQSPSSPLGGSTRPGLTICPPENTPHMVPCAPHLDLARGTARPAPGPVRAYSCCHCGRSFVQVGHMRRHERSRCPAL